MRLCGARVGVCCCPGWCRWGTPELDERIGGALDPLDGPSTPPAVEPIERQLRLARLVQRVRGLDAAEAIRLAADLGRTLDQLIVEEVAPARLRELTADLPDLAGHWQSSLDALELILRQWPAELAELGRVDLSTRRNHLLDALERRWRAAPPSGFVCAAGINISAPAVARLLRRVALLDQGLVVFPALDLDMAEAEWDLLGPHQAEPGRRAPPSLETHPQFHLKLLLERMGFARGEVARWRWGGGRDAAAVRARAIGNAMAPAGGDAALAEAAARRTTPVGRASAGSGGPGRGGAGDRACAARGAGAARAHRRPGDARSWARPPRGRASAALEHRGRRQRGAAAVADAARHVPARGSQRRRPNGLRPLRC
jgi:hypothetical protein